MKTLFSQDWISLLIGIIGIVIGVIGLLLYRASRIGPRLVYQLRASRLIGIEEQELPKEVEIFFKRRSVLQLTKAHVVFWNAGNATLDGEKIVPGDPLRLEFKEGTKVLKVRIPKRTHKANKFTARVNPDSPNKVICGFDYLNAGDGATIELLHTDEERYPKIQGSIRGLTKGVLSWGSIPFFLKELQGLYFLFFFTGTLIFLIGVIQPLYAFVLGLTDKRNFLVVGVILIFSSLLSILRPRKRFPKRLMIEDFEK